MVSLVTKHRRIKYIGYALAAVFISVFLLGTQSIQSAVCGGNYILVSTSGVVAQTYFPLYYSIADAIMALEIMMFVAMKPIKNEQDRLERSILGWLLAGLAAFIVPTGAVYLLSPAARHGVPSIMCGFAVFLAIILVLFVYPRCKKAGI